MSVFFTIILIFFFYFKYTSIDFHFLEEFNIFIPELEYKCYKHRQFEEFNLLVLGANTIRLS